MVSLTDFENKSLEENINIMTPDDEKVIQLNFKNQILLEIKKVGFFFNENISYYKARTEKIKDQLVYIKKNKQYKNYKENLELAIKELNKEVSVMKTFIELNIKAKAKIVKKFKKYCKFCLEKIDISKDIEEYVNMPSINLKEPLKSISDIQSEIEKVFYTHFFEKYAFNTLKKLKDYANKVYFTQIQSFYFGFFMGILAILFFLCLLIGWHFRIDMDDDAEFKTIFPMFRGYAIICMYFWLLGLNVFAWNNFNINYKLCFQFNNHYSDLTAIFKRTAVFSTMLVLMILCYMILRTKIPIISDLLILIPLEMTPLVAWFCLLVYIFFPSKNYFNYEGRAYLFNLFVESFSSIFIKCEFKHVWFMDQLTSLIGPIRDIEYTVCYYTHYTNTFNEKKIQCSNKRFVLLFLGIMPHLIRILQCIRQMLDAKKFSPFIINAGKYLINIFVAITSFYASSNNTFNSIWWMFALISTLYSYSWDLKMDFGFLRAGPNYPLREKLSYKNKAFYYFCMIINLFLRFLWVLTVSPEMVLRFIRPEFFFFLISFMEVFRRGMWNFIRVELKHIEICKEFRVTMEVELPFKKNSKGEFVLKETNLFDLNKIGKRLDKIRKSKHTPIAEENKSPLIPLNIMNKNLSENISNHPIELDNEISMKHYNLTSKASFGKVKIMNSVVTEAKISYDSGDFRKKFDLFIKNINEQTKNNLVDNKRRRSEELNIISSKSNSFRNNHNNT